MTARDPDHWARATDATLDGRVVVLDLDGIISDASHRQWYLRDGRWDWDGFFGASVDDPLIDAGAALAAAIAIDHAVVILTARPDSIRSETVAWLTRHRVRHDLLIMQPAADDRSPADFKRDELSALTRGGADVRLAFEDSPDNVAAIRELGIPTIYVHSGYYDRPSVS